MYCVVLYRLPAWGQNTQQRQPTLFRQELQPRFYTCVQCFSTTSSGFSSRQTEKRLESQNRVFLTPVNGQLHAVQQGNQAGPEALVPRPSSATNGPQNPGQAPSLLWASVSTFVKRERKELNGFNDRLLLWAQRKMEKRCLSKMIQASFLLPALRLPGEVFSDLHQQGTRPCTDKHFSVTARGWGRAMAGARRPPPSGKQRGIPTVRNKTKAREARCVGIACYDFIKIPEGRVRKATRGSPRRPKASA